MHDLTSLTTCTYYMYMYMYMYMHVHVICAHTYIQSYTPYKGYAG